MSSLVFDIIRRFLQFEGYQVRHVMNYTDVDDKIILRANQQGVDSFLLAQQYIDEYNAHLQALNILPATVNPRATTEMQNIIQLVKDLLDKGFAYVVEGDVYFRVRKMADYGKLSGRKLEEMQAGVRIEVDERKEDPMDFALWKAAKPEEPAWDSPWGKGRPGWHIECSAMSMTHLGEQIDIHGGGNDLIFPHHENEIAQSEAATGKPFTRYWMHNGMAQFSGQKMSKSIGNLITIEEFLERHEGDVLRMMVLNSSYRSPLTFNDEVISQAEAALERLRTGIKPALPGSAGASQEMVDALTKQADKSREIFLACMRDDFNTAGAMAGLFDLVRLLNAQRDEGATGPQLQPAQDSLRELTGVLGLRLEVERQAHPAVSYQEKINDTIQSLKSMASFESSADFRLLVGQMEKLDIEQVDLLEYGNLLKDARDISRKLKMYADSDSIRNLIEQLGMGIEDARGGSQLFWK
jgi:cysteinyl-tRNA synthetase